MLMIFMMTTTNNLLISLLFSKRFRKAWPEWTYFCLPVSTAREYCQQEWPTQWPANFDCTNDWPHNKHCYRVPSSTMHHWWISYPTLHPSMFSPTLHALPTDFQHYVYQLPTVSPTGHDIINCTQKLPATIHNTHIPCPVMHPHCQQCPTTITCICFPDSAQPPTWPPLTLLSKPYPSPINPSPSVPTTQWYPIHKSLIQSAFHSCQHVPCPSAYSSIP